MNELLRRVGQVYFHRLKYSYHAKVAKLATGVYIVHQTDWLAKLQRHHTKQAHTHRVKAQEIAQ